MTDNSEPPLYNTRENGNDKNGDLYDMEAVKSNQRNKNSEGDSSFFSLCSWIRNCCFVPNKQEGFDFDNNNEDSNNKDDNEKTKNFELDASKRKRRKKLWKRILCFCRHPSIQQGGSGIGISPNQSLAMYLHWMFRVNFFFLFTLSCIVFFVLTIFFAGLIVAAGRMDRNCVRVGGDPFESAGSAFADAFALSWTTFSTVGYGSTYPALGHENESPTNCLFITAVCSLESFIGVLYSGFCGAILFGKVLRIQSHAQVMFSDPIVIRYGSGVETQSHNDDAVKEEDPEVGSKNIPCPVLEFRIVNRLFNEVGGEIMDATLNVVSSIDANDADSLGGNGEYAPQLTLRGSLKSSTSSARSSIRSERGNSSIFSSKSTARSGDRTDRTVLSSILRNPGTSNAASKLVNKRIFSKLSIEAPDHPFFKRVWLARHVLDENSPILLPRVRRQIRKNGGFWPDKLNTYQGVRDSLRFKQILVSLNGVSNVSASDVYAQKIYDKVDCNVGYQFVNLLYRDGEQLKVDTDLINDVHEQEGGGGEPLNTENA